ncbi:hypothetical protein [Vibrio aphrogenes]|uniref:hypothetical protein n=1 Tax=Vibrio aphrogenes TaxID=1891186 RepID=UPI000B359879|nr:hypothetical protein [Vibrio aphrogenes]
MLQIILNYFFGIPTSRQLKIAEKVSIHLEKETNELVEKNRKEREFIERYDLLKLKCDLKYAREYALDFGLSSKELKMKISHIKEEYFKSHSKHLEKYLRTKDWY